MSHRTFTHALITFAIALLLVGGATTLTAPRADAVALLKQRAHGQLNAPIKLGKFRISQPYHGGHDGLDFAAASGTPVRSVAHGRVVKVRKWRTSYGKHVVIRHRGGKTLSAHLRSVRVHRGQKVRRGQVIGRVGSTGNSSGPHLHFVLRKHGRSVNPKPWIW
jgi:murein DD-endopeptidase MepM/ murein hydrolase activator NlpD